MPYRIYKENQELLFEEQEIHSQLENGSLTVDNFIWSDRENKWLPLSDLFTVEPSELGVVEPNEDDIQSIEGEDLPLPLRPEDLPTNIITSIASMDTLNEDSEDSDSPTSSPPPPSNEAIEKLETLKKMLEENLITEEDYSSKKAQILKEL